MYSNVWKYPLQSIDCSSLINLWYRWLELHFYSNLFLSELGGFSVHLYFPFSGFIRLCYDEHIAQAVELRREF